MTFPYPETERAVRGALADKIGSGFAMAVARGNAEPYTLYLGNTAHPESGGLVRPVAPDTLFDLASLTKILSAMPILIDTIREGKVSLRDPVQKYFPKLPGEIVTIANLIRHNSGFVAHEEFYRRPSAKMRGYIEREELIEWILAHPRAPLAEAKTVYSDLGLLLLGFLLENIHGKTIAELFETKIRKPLGLRNSGYRVLPHAPEKAQKFRLDAPTERFVATALCGFHNRLLQGEVDDNNCWALGGYSSHAGLFSTLTETLALLRHTVRQAKLFHDEFFPNAQSRPPFTQGYMLYPGLRPIDTVEWNGAIGHTGFVGTSGWYYEPTDTYVVLLGNRVHPKRDDPRFIEMRINIHRALWAELQSN